MQIRSILLTTGLSVAVMAFALSVTGVSEKGRSYKSYFRWSSLNSMNDTVQVVSGRTSVIPFEFTVDAGITEVRISLRDESLTEEGISLETCIAPVLNGVASSRVIFSIHRNGKIKAGRHSLAIVVSDTSTGRIIREGEVPFALDMLDIIWKCSC